MSNSKSITSSKPEARFPLWVHTDSRRMKRRWCKKIRGRFHYFGSADEDPNGEEALKEWMRTKDDLLAGRTPRPREDGGLTVYGMTQKFLGLKSDALEAGEITARTFSEYMATCQLLDKHFGSNRIVDDLDAEDFRSLRSVMAKRWGPVRLGNEMQRAKAVFRYAEDAALLKHPVRFGPGFKKPSAKTVRLSKAKGGSREFSAEDLTLLIGKASPNMKAMILLGINGGLGNTDLAMLEERHFSSRSGWLVCERHKTGIERRIPLWPETIKAVQAARRARRQPKNPSHGKYFFISPRGLPYILLDEKVGERTYGLTHEFRRLCKSAKVKGRAFYDLRRTFQTVAENCHDLVAVQAIMGHAARSGDMAAVYRQRVDDSRLKAAVSAVRLWLYGDQAEEGGKKTRAASA